MSWEPPQPRNRADARYSIAENAAYAKWLADWPALPDAHRSVAEIMASIGMKHADGSETSLHERTVQKEHRIRARQRKRGNVDLLRL